MLLRWRNALSDPPAAEPGGAGRAPPVAVSHVQKLYSNGTLALVDTSLTVHEGEFVTLVGPSGCGKSTLLRMVAGLGGPTAGEIRVFGLVPQAARQRQRSLAFVFQDPTLMPWRTVLGNVVLPLELGHVPRRERERRAMAALERVGLGNSAHTYPRQLSGGMKMRVSIARALVQNPRLLLMDEPFGALDEITRQHLNRELQHIWCSSELTVLFVTHNVFEAVFMSTRVVVMTGSPGRVAGVIKVPGSFPREDRFRASPDFSATVQRVLDLLGT